VEQNEFPTLEQLAERMGINNQEIGLALSRLIKEDFLSIDPYMDHSTGVSYERYNYTNWLLKAAQWASDHKRQGKQNDRQAAPIKPTKASPGNLFTIFEQELARLLSPIECETI